MNRIRRVSAAMLLAGAIGVAAPAAAGATTTVTLSGATASYPLVSLLAQKYVNRYRRTKRLVSLDEESEEGVQFSAPDPEPLSTADARLAQATDEVRSHEQNTEAQWHAALEQWQTDKQSLQQQKTNLEQELVHMQNRFQVELRQTDEAPSGKLS